MVTGLIGTFHPAALGSAKNWRNDRSSMDFSAWKIL
jgi:hypothetical protein